MCPTGMIFPFFCLSVDSPVSRELALRPTFLRSVAEQKSICDASPQIFSGLNGLNDVKGAWQIFNINEYH